MTVAEQQEKWTYRDPNSGCWIWLGFLNRFGYAKSINSSFPKEYFGHRLSWFYHKGKIPNGYEIDHLCSVRCCVNPNHLEVVTRIENIRRSWLRGFHKGHQGEKNPNHKLSREDAKQIRNLYFSRQMTQQEIGDLFKIGQSQISKTIRNKVWDEVKL